MPSRSRGALPALTTTQKRLGWDHQQNRDRLLRRHVNGARCWWCGKPMYREPEKNWDGQPLAADHSKSRAHHRRSAADRLLHGLCNKQRGDGSHDDQRPALAMQTTPDQPPTDLGCPAMGWPWLGVDR